MTPDENKKRLCRQAKHSNPGCLIQGRKQQPQTVGSFGAGGVSSRTAS